MAATRVIDLRTGLIHPKRHAVGATPTVPFASWTHPNGGCNMLSLTEINGTNRAAELYDRLAKLPFAIYEDVVTAAEARFPDDLNINRDPYSFYSMSSRDGLDYLERLVDAAVQDDDEAFNALIKE